MIINEAHRNERDTINSFYKSTGYKGSWGESERAFYISESSKIIAVVKIENIDDIFTLRGMFVLDSYKKKGYGSELLNHIESTYKNQTLYCIPFAHLNKFYGKIGFEVIPKKEFPSLLKSRIHKYQKNGSNVIAMKRLAKSQTTDRKI